MFDKKHILLIENNENEIEFFRDALEESDLKFLLSVARNTQQAFTLLNSSAADVIFIDVHLAIGNDAAFSLKKLKPFCSGPVVFYSNVQSMQSGKDLHLNLNYVQLPGNTRSMGKILRNLLPDSEHILPEEFADS
jgi:DNA-binding NtrC family response regulator